ncbi:Rossmann-like alpha/beta/alpha sandwich fold [Fagus crenata]
MLSSVGLRLHEEMKLDMQRIWKRNLGRDDRCIADSGKEARFPFLDEDVIRILLNIPLWDIAHLDQPSGIGDKKILREFGSRIARESNWKNFGSNRAANQVSAGSASFDQLQSGLPTFLVLALQLDDDNEP